MYKVAFYLQCTVKRALSRHLNDKEKAFSERISLLCDGTVIQIHNDLMSKQCSYRQVTA